MKFGKKIKRVCGLLVLPAFSLLILACGKETDGTIGNTVVAEAREATVDNREGFVRYTVSSTVEEVINDPYFGDFGRLLFPADRAVSQDMTLEEISSSNVYVWYHYIDPDKTVEIVQTLHDQAASGEQIFYDIYTEEEKAEDPSKDDTGIFFFRGNPGEKFAVVNAGGGFMYVGAMHDSFPHALELSKMGYNSFALIYRPDDPYTDLAKAISFIYDHAEELNVNPENYSLWGGSAGARMAATLGNGDALPYFGRPDIPQAAAVIMQYTGYSTVSEKDAPTYACVGTSDGIASFRTMQSRLQSLGAFGIPTEFHSYEGLPHGFGLGTGTAAEGWIKDAVRFWEEQCKSDNGGKILIAYFTAAENSGVDAVSSASYSVVNGAAVGRVRAIADMIQENTGGDLFSIQTSVVYPSDGGKLIDYADKEQSENARPELTGHIEDLNQYDVIFVGYPNWWYDMPMVMYSFFEEYDFSGKTIIPFNVHNGSRFSDTIGTIQKLEPNAVVIEDGFTINEKNVPDAGEDVKDWLSGLGY